jgi:hypothetical protein
LLSKGRSVNVINFSRRLLPVAMGLGLAVTAFGANAQSGLVPAAQDLTGVYWAKSAPANVKPMDGSALPYTAAGRKMAAEAQASLKADKAFDRAKYMCLPRGMPRAYATRYPIQFISSPGVTTIMFEENRQVAVVRELPEHHDPEFWDPSYMGDSIGKWEGDTYVVDSRNFIDEVFLDDSLIPHGEKLKVVQRIRKLDGGKQLEVVTTVTDPDVFTKPWSTRFVYDRRDDIELKTDWICGEPATHRDVSMVQITK